MISPPPFTALLKLAWKHYVDRFDVILLVNVVVALPLYLSVDVSTPRELLAALADRPTPNPETLSQLMDIMAADFEVLFSNGAYRAHMFIQFVTAWLVTLVPVTIMVWMKATSQRKYISAQNAIRGALVYYPATLVAVLVITILTSLGYMALLVPGLVLSVLLLFTIPAMVLRNKKLWPAMKHSIHLVKAHWWTVLTYLVGVELIVGVISTTFIFALPSAPGFDTAAFTVVSLMASFNTVFIVLLFSALEALEHIKRTQKENPPTVEVAS